MPPYGNILFSNHFKQNISFFTSDFVQKVTLVRSHFFIVSNQSMKHNIAAWAIFEIATATATAKKAAN